MELSACIEKRKSVRAYRPGAVDKAATVLVVMYDRIDYTRGDEKMFDHISLGACMEHMCLAAVDKGLGTLWIGFICLAEKEISEMLGQTDKKMAAALAIGWPDEAVPPEESGRDAVADIATWR